MIIRYASTAELRADYLKRVGGPNSGRRGFNSYSSDNWYANESVGDSLRLAETGDTRLVPEAERLLASLDTHIETPRRTWHRSPAGAFSNIPEYLAGIPTYMRRLVDEPDDRAPITILVVTTSSAGINAATLAKRGTVILALVMALTRIRPVSLQQICMVDGRHEGETIITSEINTAPLDLATACYVLTSAGFARRLTYDLARAHNDFTGGWPRKMVYWDPQPYYETVKRRLTPDPTKCLIIGAAQLGDELLQHPLQWIQKQVNYFTQMQTQEEETAL